MNVAVFINSKAGKANPERLKKSLSEALFRCHLDFYFPDSVEDMKTLIFDLLTTSTPDRIVICGGDGTLNTGLQSLIRAHVNGLTVPPLLCLPAGTANDLASELGISSVAERAARALLQENLSVIDVLEVEANGQKHYMVTNGGAGIPAETANSANQVRNWSKEKLKSSMPAFLKSSMQALNSVIEKSGSRIYEMAFLKDFLTWDNASWEVEVTMPDKTPFRTKAPFILVSNQPTLGAKFLTAPLTSNKDGYFNVLLIDSPAWFKRFKSVLDLRLGRTPSDCPTFETSELLLKAVGPKPLTFFGDGEILFKDVREIRIKCLHQGLQVVSKGVS